MFKNKRIYLRGYNITKDKVMLAVQPKPAQFSENHLSGSYQVSKNGYIQVDFTPIEEGSNLLVPNSRRTFILLMKSVGDILDLDTWLAYDAAVDEDGSYIQYHNRETEPIKVLRINKLPDKRMYRFTYVEVSPAAAGDDPASAEPKNVIGIDLTFGEVKTLQTLVEYSIPIILGWHCIYNPSVVAGGGGNSTYGQ
jgi:hypothetical protein